MLAKLSKLGWYWHRLRAMSPREIALRVQKKAFQFSDARYRNDCVIGFESTGSFPVLPRKEDAPPELLEALARDADRILRGEWKAFGHLPLKVDDPPKWQHDYLVGRNVQSSRTSFKLDHRAQSDGADIKVIWEPNRWYQLVRLAMAAWLLENGKAQEKCVEWLADWARNNPPFTGLNWTSGLETGIRLVQFTWIDALLVAAKVPNKILMELRRQILPPHVHYTWRYRSFGSSANNHLIGELAGLILALSRWPELQRVCAPLREIARLMEREILAQFAPDGGNQEQALGYHLFSWEFCHQAVRALDTAGITVSGLARERLTRAGEFYCAVKPEGDIWDFGDSDNAWVTPLFASEASCAGEWWKWFENSTQTPALRYWWGGFQRSEHARARSGEWIVYKESGYAVFRTEDWFLRLDFSSLGYLSMAPHGHLDALHLSAWFRGEPIVIDPGTGAYHSEKTVRNYLADWAAHNGPQLKNAPAEFPKRFGTFLWGAHHEVPEFMAPSPESVRAEITLPYGKAVRSVSFLKATNSIRIEDRFESSSAAPVVTRWKFAPGVRLTQTATSSLELSAPGRPLCLTLGPSWNVSASYNPPGEFTGKLFSDSSGLAGVPREALISPAFRALAVSSHLVLESVHAGSLDLTISPG